MKSKNACSEGTGQPVRGGTQQFHIPFQVLLETFVQKRASHLTVRGGPGHHVQNF